MKIMALKWTVLNTALFHTIIQQLKQQFNVLQQKSYSVTVALECDNLCLKYLPFLLTQTWESRASVLDMTSDGRIIHISALSCCCQSVMVSALHWCICFGMNILLILQLIVRSIVRIIVRFCWNEICFQTWGNYQIIEHFNRN